jgi:hypothetical protein
MRMRKEGEKGKGLVFFLTKLRISLTVMSDNDELSGIAECELMG